MAADNIKKTIRTILAKNPDSVEAYHALSDDERKQVIKKLEASGCRILTNLLKAAKKKAFSAAAKRFIKIAQTPIRTPVYLVDETLIKENMRILRYIKDRTGCRVLHALKAYASFATFPMMAGYLDGVCASGVHEARLGREEFPKHKNKIDGFHFHAMCEQNSDVLERILKSFERLYGPHIRGLKWVNFGGGHHITRDDYNIERLIRLINNFKKKYSVEVYLEPGEASVLNAGVLISSVLDIVRNEAQIAIMDAAAETHMPDVLLMPYRPHIMNSGQPGDKGYTYRIAGPSCVAGDIMGDFSFDRPLRRGDKLVFIDMALYSIVKSTTFNGINLPDIMLVREGGKLRLVKTFGYRDYRNRQS